MAHRNRVWDEFMKTKTIGVDAKPIIRPHDRVFTMGSCFANEIRHALEKRNFTIYPATSGEFRKHVSPASFEPTGHWGEYDERVHWQFYTTFSMLQEFEKAFGLWQHDPSEVWAAVQKTSDGQRTPIFQEPFKRRLFAHSLEDILALRKLMEDALRVGIMTAEVLVLTMGLTEVWRAPNGRYVCEAPTKLRSKDFFGCRAFGTTYEQNLKNMRKLCTLYFNAFPDRNIFLTVSPIALHRTFTPLDIAIANSESKAILRAVAAQIVRDFPNVHYFPSFELCQYDPHAFHEDGRHVLPAKVDSIMAQFMDAFLAPPDAAGQTATAS